MRYFCSLVTPEPQKPHYDIAETVLPKLVFLSCNARFLHGDLPCVRSSDINSITTVSSDSLQRWLKRHPHKIRVSVYSFKSWLSKHYCLQRMFIQIIRFKCACVHNIIAQVSFRLEKHCTWDYDIIRISLLNNNQKNIYCSDFLKQHLTI